MGKRTTARTLAGVAAAFAAVALTACGGGGSTTDAANAGGSPEGVYGGTLTGSTSSAFQMVILENGDLWALYGTQGASTFFVRGLIQGAGAWSQGNYTVAQARDFGFQPALAGRLNGRFEDSTTKTISGTGSFAGTYITFSGGPIPGLLHRYDTPASLAATAGSWSLTAISGEVIALNVASDGRFSGASNTGCTLSGTLAPRPSGKNVFNITLTFGPAPCLLAGQGASGIALVAPLATGQSQLIVAATDAARSVGTAAFGVR